MKPGDVVIFQVAWLFSGGRTRPDYGPVKLVNRLFRQNPPSGWTVAEEVHALLVVECVNSTKRDFAISDIPTAEEGPGR